MKLRKARVECKKGYCPTVYGTDLGTYVVQGHIMSDLEELANLGVAEGEGVVSAPGEQIKETARALS